MSTTSSTQLTFTLRTSPNCKTVHLIGNWDGYKGQLPLAKDSGSSKSGAWKGTFRFSNKVLQSGGRYWYYYIMDGYHVSHDPAQPYTTEPTTGRQLNILDVPATSSSSSSSKSSSSSSSHFSHRSRDSSASSRGTSSSHSSRGSSSSNSSNTSRSSSSSSFKSRSKSPPKGRPVSPSRIAHPRPVHPSSTTQQRLQSSSYAKQVASLSKRLAKTKLHYASSDSGIDTNSGSEFEEDRILTSSDDSSSDDDSDISDGLPSLGSGSSRTSPCSSAGTRARSNGSEYAHAHVKSHSHNYGRSDSRGSSSSASSVCSCDRWGITRKGDRVRIDCGGSRCNSAPSSPSLPALSPGGMSPTSPAESFDYQSGFNYEVRAPGDVAGGFEYAGGYAGYAGYTGGYDGMKQGCSSSESDSEAEEWKVLVQQTSRGSSGKSGSKSSSKSGTSGSSGSHRSGSSGSGTGSSGRRHGVVVRGGSRR